MENWKSRLRSGADRLADPTPNTGYEPKFCIDVSSQHTPINLPSRKSSFNLENDATVAASEDFDLSHHSGASSSRHSVASTVQTLLNLGSSSTRRLAADHATVVSVEESLSRRKRDRDENFVQTLKDRQNFHKLLERKAEPAVRADAEMEITNWEREILILLFVRLIKNSNVNDYSHNSESMA